MLNTTSCAHTPEPELASIAIGWATAEETADAVGSTPGAVRVAQHRALAKLKSEISATGYDSTGYGYA